MNMLTPSWLIITALTFSLVPILIAVCTSYLKINIVLGMLRNGLGTQHAPSTLVVMTLSLALSSFVMAPVIEKSLESSDVILSQFQSSNKTVAKTDLANLEPVIQPWKEFMQKHAGTYEISVLSELVPANNQTKADAVESDLETITEQPWYVLIPAFLLTELKEAFSMGFILLLPFLVIDLIVANILAGMGMYMLSPTMISLPLKLLFFVISDGWLLLSQSLINSYQL